MVFGTLFIIFMLMHDIKLWMYAIPGEHCCSRKPAGLRHQSASPALPCMTGLCVAAGLLFYLLDLQLRLVQRSQPVQLRVLTTAAHKGLVALQLHADSRWPMRPIQASFWLHAACSGSLRADVSTSMITFAPQMMLVNMVK